MQYIHALQWTLPSRLSELRLHCDFPAFFFFLCLLWLFFDHFLTTVYPHSAALFAESAHECYKTKQKMLLRYWVLMNTPLTDSRDNLAHNGNAEVHEPGPAVLLAGEKLGRITTVWSCHLQRTEMGPGTDSGIVGLGNEKPGTLNVTSLGIRSRSWCVRLSSGSFINVQ